MLVKLGKLTTR